MSMELKVEALGDPGNARTLSLAADLAYLPEAEGVPAFKEKLGLDARLISVDNTQVYVAGNDEHLVVAFRGSESPTSIDGLKDWFLTNAMNLLIVPEGRLGTDFAAAGVGARFHQGFLGALAEVWDPLEAAVTEELKQKERPLWVTGHSLGGALALLASWLFQRRMIEVHQVYTFGAPMIGNDLAIAAFDKELPDRIFRYINRQDPVPLLPSMSLIANQYVHCLKEMPLGQGEGGTSVLVLFQDMAGKAVDGVLKGAMLDDFWAVLKERIGAHDIANYRTLIG